MGHYGPSIGCGVGTRVPVAPSLTLSAGLAVLAPSRGAVPENAPAPMGASLDTGCRVQCRPAPNRRVIGG